MSINHYSPEARLYWSEQQQVAKWLSNSHTPRFNLNDNQEEVEDDEEEVVAAEKGGGGGGGGGEAEEEEKEAMFEKPLTPSDVGKLNRLVIPKQHAEKHFPLESSSSSSCGDSAKGVLLSFEDELGKCWRFRYSYWNSSQSYVLTKGWSRYVKDKRLHAGDVVFFHRHRTQPQRFFITSTRRQPNPPAHVTTTATPSFYSAHPYPAHHLPFPYQTHSLHAPPPQQPAAPAAPGGGSQGQNQTTPGGNSSSARVLRLFGVNMECQTHNHSPNSSSSSSSSSYTHILHPQISFSSSSSSSSSSSNLHHHMLRQQP